MSQNKLFSVSAILAVFFLVVILLLERLFVDKSISGDFLLSLALIFSIVVLGCYFLFRKQIWWGGSLLIIVVVLLSYFFIQVSSCLTLAVPAVIVFALLDFHSACFAIFFLFSLLYARSFPVNALIVHAFLALFALIQISFFDRFKKLILFILLQTTLTTIFHFFGWGMVIFQGSAFLASLRFGFLHSCLILFVYLAVVSWAGHFLHKFSFLTLLEIIDPNYPLIKQLAFKAPGTYQHSLQVSNLAVLAGQNIGNVDVLLLQAGALLHDVGKSESPLYYIENQNNNREDRYLHKNLIQSRDIIIKHTLQGLKIARRYNLPLVIQNIILSHHGTSLTSFYYKLSNKKAHCPKNQYRYPGPKPRTKEEGLIMLADSVEAASRSFFLENNTKQMKKKLKRVIENVINSKIKDNQLSECSLTFHDLANIKKSFLATLIAMKHGRIKYNSS